MASRNAVMISGERSANCASSFLRKRRRKLGRRGVEMDDAAGAIEQHGRIRHAGNDGTDGGGLDRIDGADVVTGGHHMMQPPRHQRGGGDADEHGDGARRREIGQHHQRAQRKPGGEQDDGRMPQPVRPRRKEGGRAGIVYRHRAGSSSNSRSPPPRRQAPRVAALAHIDGLHASVRLGVGGQAASWRSRFDRAPRIISRNVSKITDMTNGAI